MTGSTPSGTYYSPYWSMESVEENTKTAEEGAKWVPPERLLHRSVLCVL
jgi:hypothetical protein